jgi:hypothetical protein
MAFSIFAWMPSMCSPSAVRRAVATSVSAIVAYSLMSQRSSARPNSAADG